MKKIWAIVFLIKCALVYAATTYYVDATNGNDLNDGMSPSTSWQSIDKVNDKSLSPGDSVLFKRGETWNIGLKIGNSGIEGSPIVFSAYGDGMNPKIDMIGQEKGHGVEFNKSGGNAYGEVRHIDIYNPGTNGIVISNGGDHNVISHCSVYNARKNGIRLVGTKANRISYTIVEYCEVHKVASNDGITLHKGNDKENDWVGTGNIVRFNTVSGCHEQGLDFTSGDHTQAEGNTTFDCNGGVVVGHQATYVTIDRHFSINDDRGSTSAIQFKNSNYVVLKNSIIVGDDVLFKTDENSGEGKPKNVEILNNTFYQSGTSEFYVVKIAALEGPIEFRNNIFHTKKRFDLEDPAIGHACYTFNSNLYYHETPGFKFFNNLYSLEEFQSNFNQEADGIEGDPVFVNGSGLFSESTDFMLSPGSPAIDAAADLGITKDFEEKTRPQGTATDIGAFEFDPQSDVADEPNPGVDHPDKFTVLQNFPNPFNMRTTISYTVQEYDNVALRVYNNKCQEVATLVDDDHSPGKYSVHWDACDNSGQIMPSGVYFYKLNKGEVMQFKKMILLK